MLNPEDPIALDLSTSCTVDEAVAKLLGCLRSPIQHRYCELGEDGLPKDESLYVHIMDVPLDVQLSELREAASLSFLEAVKSGLDYDVTQARENRVARIDHLIRQAFKYRLAIQAELECDKPKLCLDSAKTQETGEMHITLSSLNRWAQEMYDISVVDDEGLRGVVPESTQSDVLDGSAGEMTKREDSLNTTFALLVMAFAEKGGSKFKDTHGQPNHSTIAGYLTELATKDLGKDTRGFSTEMIRKRIALAFEIKNRQYGR